MLDESMIVWKPKMSQFGGLPNLTFETRKSVDLGMMLRAAIKCVTGIFTFVDPVMCPENRRTRKSDATWKTNFPMFEKTQERRFLLTCRTFWDKYRILEFPLAVELAVMYDLVPWLPLLHWSSILRLNRLGLSKITSFFVLVTHVAYILHHIQHTLFNFFGFNLLLFLRSVHHWRALLTTTTRNMCASYTKHVMVMMMMTMTTMML